LVAKIDEKKIKNEQNRRLKEKGIVWYFEKDRCSVVAPSPLIRYRKTGEVVYRYKNR